MKSTRYLRVPTNGDVELDDIDDGRSLERQQSLTTSIGSAETGRRVRQQNDRRRERLNTELLNAVSHKDVDQVQKLILEGASGRACCRKSGITALHLAASLGDIITLSVLLENGADARARDGKGREAAHLAAWAGQLEVLEDLANKDPGIIGCRVERSSISEDQEILDSWTHSHEEFDAIIPIELEDGITPLHLASMRGHVRCVDFLLKNGANVDAQTAKELTPIDVAGLHLAEPEGADDISKPRVGDIAEEGPGRFMAVAFKMVNASKKKPKAQNPLLRIYEELVNSGATMPKGRVLRSTEMRSAVQTKKVTTPMHTGVMTGDVEVIRYLLNSGACLMAWNSDEETALHLAVREKLYEPLKEMLYWDADQLNNVGSHWESKVDVRDSRGLTPLLLAAQLQWADGVALLLEEGADVTLTSNKNETVLHFAAKLGDDRMMQEFLSAPNCSKILERRDDQYYTPVCHAVESKSLDCVKLLSNSKANLAVTVPGNLTMLHKAAENNSPDIIAFLATDESVKQQDLVNKVCRLEKGGVAPLHIAALKGYHECVRELIQGGCDVSVKTLPESHRSSTALHLAARHGHLSAMELILMRDTKSHTARDDDYWTPLHVAAARGHSQCVKILLWCNADLAAAVRDESGKRTAIDLIMLCIPQPVDFLEGIFDAYITFDGKSMTDEDAKITIKYDVLVPDDRCERQLKVMNALLNCDKIDTIQKLLLHPVIETFLCLKWRKLRIFFVMIMILYGIMTSALTVYAHLMYVEKTSDPLLLDIANAASCVMIFFDFIILFLEIMNLIQLHRFYIKDFESLIKWGMIITCFVVGMADPTYNWTKYVAATAVLLSWLELLFLLARCPSWGYYVLMFSRVAVDVLKVLSTFVLMFIGFTFSFLILFEGTDPFRNFFESFIKLLVMTLEFDYQNMFEPVKGVTALSVTGRLTFISFLILVSIVMMNLMLGLAVNDISALKAQGKTQRLVKQTQFLSLLEMLVYNRTLKRLLPLRIYRPFEDRRAVDDKIIVRPAKPLESINHTLPKSLREAVIDSIWSKSQDNEVEVTISLQDINQKIEDLTDVVKRGSSSSSSSVGGGNILQPLLSVLEDIQHEQAAMKAVLDDIKSKIAEDRASRASVRGHWGPRPPQRT
uniref:Transient receptor potential channel pyrexia n=1 Tax=Lygus hesperus TaxID=30085 RepID=A0A0A9WWU2_LYGHE